MRSLLTLSILAIGLTAQASAQQTSCPNNGTTSISGNVYAPNGIDPLPNVTVYIPSAPVDPFVTGVDPAKGCPAPGQPPSGSPLVGTQTTTDGSFTITNVPVGTNIPLVIVSGKWRRQFVVPSTTACADTPIGKIRFARNQSEGDIPRIAVITGSADQVECVLRKVGVDDIEFTNPAGTGRINLYQADGSPGARIDASTPTTASVMSNLSDITSYDVLMLPCEGGNYSHTAQQLTNLIQFANAGGRIYSSHFSYSWMYQNAPFSTVVNWTGTGPAVGTGLPATVDTTFAQGKTLADWLQLVGASTTKGQISLTQVKHDFNGVKPPTQSWLTLNSNGATMQFVFDTPVGVVGGQCGRVLYNEYHVEAPSGSPANKAFPIECPDPSTAMTPQEKLLEFSLFELTDDGGQATLTPLTADFGSEPVGFTTASQTFTFTNNSTFSTSANVAPASSEFPITANSCGALAGGASCQISVAFSPTALGPRTGTLSVSAGAQTLNASLTGTGVPALIASPTSLNFGSVDVGATSILLVTVTSNAPSALPFPGVVASGDYTASSNCGSTIAALSSCTVTVVFKPTTTGTRTGTMTANSSNPAYAGISTQLTGNGIDFSISVNPVSGSTLAGYGSSTTALVTPIAGFASNVTVSCTTNAVASTCVPTLASFIPSTATSTPVTITTTSKYTVVGYGGLGGTTLLSVLAFASVCLLWTKRRSTRILARSGLAFCFLAAAATLTTGCSGKLPDQNASYTGPGDYTYTITATDGFLAHSATYSLHLTVK